MTKLTLASILILLSCHYVNAKNFDGNNIIGQWGGCIEYAERLEAINIVFNNENNIISGILTLVYEKEDIPLENINIRDSNLSFNSKYDKGKIEFYGEISGDSLNGKITLKTPRAGSQDGSFRLSKGRLIKEDTLFLERLRSYEEYDSETTKNKYQFSYMDSSDINLSKFRYKYNLDSIAGNDSEEIRLINLMQWVKNVVPYNGSSGFIEPANSLYLLENEKAKNKGLNCWMKSIILNDVYLAMGYPSRVVNCMPKGNNFIEDHFIVIVYSSKLKKWIYMDPSVGAFLKDENGNLLDIQEVRYKLIKGEKVIVNSDAVLSADLYLHYMTKNLFRFRCLFKSEFNSFSNNTEKIYCHLFPKLYFDPSVKDKKNIIVRNPNIFWAVPE